MVKCSMTESPSVIRSRRCDLENGVGFEKKGSGRLRLQFEYKKSPGEDQPLI